MWFWLSVYKLFKIKEGKSANHRKGEKYRVDGIPDLQRFFQLDLSHQCE
jgi:hypothetical protein